MELNETFESQINRSDYKILIVDDVVSNQNLIITTLDLRFKGFV